MRKNPANSNTEYGSVGMLCFAVSKHLAICGTEWKRSSHHAVFCGLRAPCRLRNWVKTVFIRPVNSLPYIASHVTHAFGILTVKRIRFIGRRIVLSSVDASPVNWDIDVPLPSEPFFLCCMVRGCKTYATVCLFFLWFLVSTYNLTIFNLSIVIQVMLQPRNNGMTDIETFSNLSVCHTTSYHSNSLTVSLNICQDCFRRAILKYTVLISIPN